MTALVVIWFILIAVLWTVYLVLEGFDFGVGMLLPVVAKTKDQKTAAVRTIGPHWDGNEVWLLTAGGAMFAAFPLWYATMFSGMYFALFLMLVLLILRVIALEWRSKVKSQKWVDTWDWFQTVSAYGVPLILGVAFSNLVSGIQMKAQTGAAVDGRMVMTDIEPGAVASALGDGNVVYNMVGGFWSLFTFYSVLGGLTLVAISFAHGAQYLSMKTEGPMQERATKVASWASVVAVALGAVWVIWGQLAYSHNAWGWIPLVVAAIGLILAAAFSQEPARHEGWAFTFSSIGIAGAVAWVFSTMAPYVLKSSIDEAYSLPMSWAASSQATLSVMLVVAIVLVPIVIAYTVWSYWVFRGRVNPKKMSATQGLLPEKIRPKANFLTGRQG